MPTGTLQYFTEDELGSIINLGRPDSNFTKQELELIISGGKKSQQQTAIDRMRARQREIEAEEEALPPAGIVDRFQASFASTPKGEANIFAERGVREDDPSGRSLWEDVKDIPGDLADVAAPALTMASSIAGGTGGALATPAVPFLGASAGASGTAIAANALRQGMGRYFGSQEPWSRDEAIHEGQFGALGEGLSKPIAAAGRFFRGPYRGSVTDEMKREVVDPATRLDEALGSELLSRTPASSQSAAKSLAKMEGRAGTRTSSVDDYQRTVREPFREEQQNVYSRIRDKIGVRETDHVSDFGEEIVNAAKKRESELVAEQKIRQSAMIDETRSKAGQRLTQRDDELNEAAVRRSAERRQQELDSEKELSKAIRKKENELKKLNDARGKPTREFFHPHQVKAREMAEQDLPGEIEDLQKARDKVAEQLRKATDVEAERMKKISDAEIAQMEKDATRELVGLQKARDDLSLSNLDQPTLQRILKDDDSAGSVFRTLTGPQATQAKIRAFKEAIGAIPSPGNPVATEEGKAAWKSAQAHIFSILKQAAEDLEPTRIHAVPLNGRMLEQALEGLGGRRILTEFLDPHSTDMLYDLARFLRQSDVTARSFATLGKGDLNVSAAADIWSTVRKGAQFTTDKMFAGRLKTPKGKQFFTTGRGENTSGVASRVLGQGMGQGISGGIDALNGR